MKKETKTIDVAILGAGPGGIRAARRSGEAGLSTVLFEAREVGGTCTNRGCVPKKMINIAASGLHKHKIMASFGWSAPPPIFQWKTLQAHSNAYIERARASYQRTLDTANVHVVHEAGWVNPDGTVESISEHWKAKRVVLACGGHPFIPDIPGKELLSVSDDVFTLPSLPQHVVVLGGGYIACEMATMLAALGSSVTLVYRGDLPLRRFDDDLRLRLKHAMESSGIQLLLNRNVCRVENALNHQLRLTLDDGTVIPSVDLALCALGRSIKLPLPSQWEERLQKRSNGTIVVDSAGKTSIDGLFAVGDITGTLELAPVAVRQSENMVRHWLGNPLLPLNPEQTPRAVFTHPHLASVGLTEAEARIRFDHVTVRNICQHPMSQGIGNPEHRTQSEQALSEVFYKIVCSGTDQRIVGIHMIGEETPELLQVAALLVTQNMPLSSLSSVVALHPTTAEELVLIS